VPKLKLKSASLSTVDMNDFLIEEKEVHEPGNLIPPTYHIVRWF
jgi:hypothetical protein